MRENSGLIRKRTNTIGAETRQRYVGTRRGRRIGRRTWRRCRRRANVRGGLRQDARVVCEQVRHEGHKSATSDSTVPAAHAVTFRSEQLDAGNTTEPQLSRDCIQTTTSYLLGPMHHSHFFGDVTLKFKHCDGLKTHERRVRQRAHKARTWLQIV